MDQLSLPYRVVDANDDPVAGALVYVYRTGTTTLSTDIYQGVSASAHTNPVVADGTGVIPAIFFDGGYEVRVRATTAAGAVIFDRDPVPRVSSGAAAASTISFVPGATNPATNVQAAIENLQDDVDEYALAAGLMDPGSVATPGLRFSVDTDTGLYRAGSNQLAFSEGGVDRGRIYGRKNVVGTVIQEDGNPAGALIQRGSTADGEFRRWADGTQICTHRITTSASGNVTWTFPATFVSVDCLLANGDTSNSPYIGTIGFVSGTSVTVSLFNGASRVAAIANVYAIGTWF